MVDLQDYNKEVLEAVTGPNVLVNCAGVPSTLRYFSGDWGSLSSLVGRACYDVILTAETIYSEESVHTLIQCMDELLKPEGVAFIAAKSYYFGENTPHLLSRPQFAGMRRSGSDRNWNEQKPKRNRNLSACLHLCIWADV